MFSVWQVLQRNFDENLATIEAWQKALARLPIGMWGACLLYTSPSPRDRTRSRMPSSA